jgi:hypothetical protein
MIEIGYMLGMLFVKDPEENISNVVIKGIYMDKVWVEYTVTGNQEVIDIEDVAFKNPVLTTPPERDFIVRERTGTWLYWDHKQGFWYECDSPIEQETTEIEESEDEAPKSSIGQTLH